MLLGSEDRENQSINDSSKSDISHYRVCCDKRKHARNIKDWDYLEHAHWVNLQIMERFRAEGINFAFPTQTVHLAGDEKPAIPGKHKNNRKW